MQLMKFSLNLLTNKFARQLVAKPKKQKVFVGISGGVDSAVSAVLLKKQGYDVVGVFIRTWQPDFIECTWRDERRDAIRICAHLNIPFLECDAEQEYRDMVGLQMVNDYKNGLTPNPDILCNREVKFGVFWQFAKAHGADFIATGHYAKIEKVDQKYFLTKPKDIHKDQTYFLWTLQSQDLEHTLFPLDNLTKNEVRKIAKKNNLPNAIKKDSQGVCFLGPIDLKDFISHYIKLEKGSVLNEKGEVIGTHDGAIIYTLGQRHGFIITKNTDDEKPYYIVDRNIGKNTITVSHEHTDKKFAKKDFILRDGLLNKQGQEKVFGIYRYNGEEILVEKINKNGAEIKVIFEKPLLIAPGQSIVFYQNNLLIGGGICL